MTDTIMKKHIEIAVGIIRSQNCQIFITQRGEDSHLAGFWEFPGGKIEQGETPYQTLQREIAEEVDMMIVILRFMPIWLKNGMVSLLPKKVSQVAGLILKISMRMIFPMQIGQSSKC